MIFQSESSFTRILRDLLCRPSKVSGLVEEYGTLDGCSPCAKSILIIYHTTCVCGLFLPFSRI